MSTTTMIILWHFFFAVVGFLIGILVGRRIERQSAPPVKPLPPAPVEEVPAQKADASLLKAGWLPNEKMWVEISGVRVDGKPRLDPGQQEILSRLMLQLRPWLEGEKPVQASVVPTPAPVQKIPLVEKKAPPVQPEMKSMIEQINDRLQARLLASPFKERGIELVEGAGGSVIVVDGSRKYEGIDAVPDPEVQALIRESVADWEKSAK